MQDPSAITWVAALGGGHQTGSSKGVTMSVNEELVAAGLRVLRGPLSLFVCRGLETEYDNT